MHLELPHKFDPKAMFVDPASLDFTMREDFKPVPGFKEIPFGKIGLKLDEFRREMPDKATYRRAVKEKYQDVDVGGGKYDLDLINQRYGSPPYLAE